MLISKKNEVYLRLIDVEPSIAAELNDFFTFEVPGFKYMPAYRSKMWDGKIYPVYGKQLNCIILALYLFGSFLGDRIFA